MHYTRQLRFVAATLLMLTGFVCLSFGQASMASLSGTVVDQKNAVIAGATVSVNKSATVNGGMHDKRVRAILFLPISAEHL